MLVYLMRHGIASPRGELGIDDAARALTPEGADKVRRICSALRRLKVEFDEIWTSSLIRAKQTAEIVASVWGLGQEVRIVPALEPGGDLRALIDMLRCESAARGVLLTGHEPDMGELAGMLISGRSDATIRFKKGGVGCIELNETPKGGTGELLWLLTPKQLCKIA
ncbi:MAG TPA: phosphohistidine phosphatase SixA [Phycisphaerae bacterium]|nr:phosphohistidine phosphatase SixA [Phycisphaerae bacterium]